MAQQVRQSLHDEKTESEAAASFAHRVVDLMVLFEDCVNFLAGDADSGVPDLNAHHSLVSTAAEQYFAGLRIFQRIREQVADHLLEQARIAVYPKAARHRAHGNLL